MDPELFGPYRLEALIGRGGMGEVFRAFDTVKKRTVAVKRLPHHLAASAEFQARFRKESELAARLREPHVIPIHDYGEIDGHLFIEMRLVEGIDLAELIKERGGLPPARAVNIVAQVASALEAAHADGLVHRDIKPSNILVTGADRGEDYVYLVDFGIARAAGGVGTVMTATGATVGTVDYMAPERFISGHGDHRVDIYALGCVLHELLTGRKPYSGEGLPAMMYAHVNMPVPRPSSMRPGLPPGLDAVVARAMAKEPDQRFRTAGELATAARAALEQRAAPPPVHGPPPQPSASRPVDRTEYFPPGGGYAQQRPQPQQSPPTYVAGPGYQPPGSPGGGWVQPPQVAPPARRRTIWIIAGGAVLLVALVVVLAVALTSNANSARSAAQAFVDAVNISDLNAVRSLTCASEQDNLPSESDLGDLSLSLGTVQEMGDQATVEISAQDTSGSSSSARPSQAVSLKFVRENGKWRYCGQA